MNLKQLNTFGAQASAGHFFEITDARTYQELLSSSPQLISDALILGGGSNILFTRDYVPAVLRIGIKGISVEETDGNDILVTAGAGVVWDDLVQYCIQRGFYGIENLSLIPGCCGAAPMQNIGAYGVELVQVFSHLEAMDRKTGEIKTFSNKDCRFGYRSSVFKTALKNRFIIASITLRLSRIARLTLEYGAISAELSQAGITQPTPKDVSQAVIRIRRSKLPDWHAFGNAGSFFKNPVIPNEQFEEIRTKFAKVPHYAVSQYTTKVPAGWLIDQCGLKGYRMGNVGTWHQQALVIVNYGSGSGAEILDFARKIRDTVASRFNIQLEPEVNLIGMNQDDF